MRSEVRFRIMPYPPSLSLFPLRSCPVKTRCLMPPPPCGIPNVVEGEVKGDHVTLDFAHVVVSFTTATLRVWSFSSLGGLRKVGKELLT